MREQLLEGTSEVLWAKEELPVSLSIGIASAAPGEMTYAQLYTAGRIRRCISPKMMEKGRSSLPDSIKQAAYHGNAACFSVLIFQKIFKLSVEFFRIFQKQSVAAAREDYKPAFSAQMFFHIFPVGRSVEEAVTAVGKEYRDFDGWKNIAEVFNSHSDPHVHHTVRRVVERLLRNPFEFVRLLVIVFGEDVWDKQLGREFPANGDGCHKLQVLYDIEGTALSQLPLRIV